MISLFRSRMFTTAFKFFASMAVLAFVAAFVSAVSTNDQGLIDRVLGPLTLGWKGGVGNHFLYVSFVSLAILSGFLAGVSAAFRDNDPDAQAQLLDVETLPPTRSAPGSIALPIAAVVALAVIIYGQFGTKLVTPIGFGLMGLVIVGWTLQTVRTSGSDSAA